MGELSAVRKRRARQPRDRGSLVDQFVNQLRTPGARIYVTVRTPDGVSSCYSGAGISSLLIPSVVKNLLAEQ